MQAEVRNATNRENRNDKKVKPTTESTTEISILSRKSTGSTTIPTTTKRSVWKRNEEGKGNLEVSKIVCYFLYFLNAKTIFLGERSGRRRRRTMGLDQRILQFQFE